MAPPVGWCLFAAVVRPPAEIFGHNFQGHFGDYKFCICMCVGRFWHSINLVRCREKEGRSASVALHSNRSGCNEHDIYDTTAAAVAMNIALIDTT